MDNFAQKSHIGWRVASVLDKDELAIKEKEESTKAVTAAQKAVHDV